MEATVSKNKNGKRLGILAALVTLAVTASASAALFFVYPPITPPVGVPYSTHAANWWKWLLTQPASKSPLLDTTGASCGQGQSGLVWFLAGAPDSNPVLRNCTIPGGRTIIFPVVNSAYFAFPSDPANQKTEAFLRSQVTNITTATELEVEIDGVSIPNVKSYLEKSALFSVTLPADNIFGLPPDNLVLSPAVDSGYYLALTPFLPGRHTIHFHGSLGGSVQDVSYALTVKLL